MPRRARWHSKAAAVHPARQPKSPALSVHEWAFLKLAREIYEFGAAAGSFEGYVYGDAKVDPKYLPSWADNLLQEYTVLTRYGFAGFGVV
jgi:hypothetical protein